MISTLLTIGAGLLFLFFLISIALVVSLFITPVLIALLVFYILLAFYKLCKRVLKQERQRVKDVL